MVRRSEARIAAQCTGVKKENIYALDMPFYESGKVEKKPITQVDIDIIYDLIQKIKPEVIYAAGDLTDPHGTHRVCL